MVFLCNRNRIFKYYYIPSVLQTVKTPIIKQKFLGSISTVLRETYYLM